jgi:hypothetical protein
MKADWYRTRRFVLCAPTGLDEVSAFATSLGWEKTAEGPADPEKGTGRWVIWRALDIAELHYMEEVIFDTAYYVLTGQEPRIVDALADRAQEALEPWDIGELVEAFDEAENSKRRTTSAVLLALSAGFGFDEQIFTRVVALLENPDAAIRGVGVSAALYAGYHELRPCLQAIAENDPDEGVRANAASVLEQIKPSEKAKP